MNVESTVSFVVMRSPQYKFKIMEKSEHETSSIDSKLAHGWLIVKEGTEDECKNYRTKGQLFLEKNGYSRTLANLIKKHNVTIEEYKVIRRDRKKEQLKETRAKHDRARAGRKTKATK